MESGYQYPPMFTDGRTPGDGDIVIALMGMTGSGKSSLIGLCTDQDIEIGHKLNSCTQEVETHTFQHSMLRSGRVYLVDTPGFDDTNRKDTEILRTLSAWLTATYDSGVKLSGIIYCHRINQTRMPGSALRNIQLFRSLCGDNALGKVILVTTMWDIEKFDIAERREKELAETARYWGGMVAKGSRVLRHHNTKDSALALIETFIKDDSKIVLSIQNEMVENKKSLDKTEAGKEVKDMLEKENASLRAEIEQFKSELKEALRMKDAELASTMQELRLEHENTLQQVLDNQKRLQETMEQLHASRSIELEVNQRSRISPQPPNRALGFTSDISDINEATEAYDSPKEPSRDQSEKIWMKTLCNISLSTSGTGNRRVSMDGSHLAIRDRGFIVLFSAITGKEIEVYKKSPNEVPGHPQPMQFSTDGKTLGIWDGVCSTYYKVRRGQRYMERLFSSNKNARLCVVSRNMNIVAELDADASLEMVWLPTLHRCKLIWNRRVGDEPEHRPKFSFTDDGKLLICFNGSRCYFFSTTNGKLTKTVDVPSPAPEGTWTGDFILSDNSLFLSMSWEKKEQRLISIFRLSSSSLDIIMTLKANMGPWSSDLSCSGSYVLLEQGSQRVSIWNVLSDNMLFAERLVDAYGGSSLQNVDYGTVRFFPSDDRLMFMSDKSIRIVRLIKDLAGNTSESK